MSDLIKNNTEIQVEYLVSHRLNNKLDWQGEEPFPSYCMAENYLNSLLEDLNAAAKKRGFYS